QRFISSYPIILILQIYTCRCSYGYIDTSFYNEVSGGQELEKEPFNYYSIPYTSFFLDEVFHPPDSI
ncbi:MAG: hypothetical protein ACI9FN_002290, partial [Saprospiraceae bacterium]